MEDMKGKLKLMDSRIRTGYVPVTIALVMLLLFVTPVMADDWVGGIPLETIKSGVVSGGLYHDAVFGFNYTGPNGTITDDGNTVEKVFTLPSHTEVKWARLYVAAYCGSMKGNYQVNLEVNFDGAGDGAYDKTWNEHLNSEYGYPGEGGDGPVYLDNGTRVTSDYLYWYDVTDVIDSTSVKTLVKTSKPDGYTGTFDGRIKLVALVIAYEDGSTDQVHYWVNQGHDVSSYYDEDYKGRISFDTSKLSGVDPESADLTIFHMASKNGDLWIGGEPVTGTEPQGSYSGSYQWDVLDQMPGSSIDFEYRFNTDKDVNFFKIPLAFLTIKQAERDLPDLTIAGPVNPIPPTAIFARESNPVRIINVKNNGPGAATNIPVALYASDVSTTDPVNTTTIDALASGEQTNVIIVDPTIRDHEGGKVIYTAVVDPENTIDEVDKTNNKKSSVEKPVRYNGYKGKGIYWEGGSNITTKRTYDLQGDIVYASQPESAYKSIGWTDRTEIWTGTDLSIPAGATIEDAWLYIVYNWDQTAEGVPSVTVTFNDKPLILDTPYTDKSNFGGYPNHKYGLYPAVDVTDHFVRDGDNTLIMTANAENKNALYPSTLAVVYRDPSATRKQIFINEECDVLAYSESTYGTSLEEATAYVPFSDMEIETTGVQKATLHSFAGSAGPDEGNLFFNGDTVETSAWQGTANTCEALVANVTAYITATGNEAAVQSTDSGGMCTYHQFLVIEYSDETGLPDLTVSTLASNSGEVFSASNNTYTAMITNIGTGDAGAFDVGFNASNVTGTVPVAGLAAGADITITWTDETIHSAGDVVTITVTTDPKDSIREADEENNHKSITKTVVHNGYRGMRWTDGEDITTAVIYTVRGDLVYSSGNSTYLSASTYPNWTDYVVTWTAGDLAVPAGATIAGARLYVPYTWDKGPVFPEDVTLTFNSETVDRSAFYEDEKMWGSSYPYGMTVYDVTDIFSPEGNTALLTNTFPGGGNVSIRGMLLAVVYDDGTTAPHTVLMNEGFDLLYGGAAQSTTPEQATAYAPFNLNAKDALSARLVTVAPGAGPTKGDLIFNDRVWTRVWNYTGTTQIGVDDRDVTTLLGDENLAGFRSDADYMEAAAAFLVVEYSDETGLPDLSVSAIKPNAGAGDNIFANELNTISVTVENQGTGSAGASILLVDVGGTEYTRPVGTLAPGANETVTITHNVLYAHGAVVNVTATADS
ncbi:MAG: DUF3344 domain-containing protein, partial [Methanomicrobiales archaeon]|nr:DUF3344 domain-containing protein [Methanomicrobiales archaeon]